METVKNKKQIGFCFGGTVHILCVFVCVQEREREQQIDRNK